MSTRESAAVEDDEPGPWPAAGWPRESAARRVWRGLLLSAVALVVVAGLVSITSTITGWVRPARAPSPPAVSDLALAGAGQAAAMDYLSWGPADRPARAVALARDAGGPAGIDGWNGAGQQRADAAVVTGLHRAGGHALVTVRARVIPASTPPDSGSPEVVWGPPAAPSDAGGRLAPDPPTTGPGASPQPARWVTVAVPVSTTPPVRVTASPALVGAPAEQVPPAAPSSSSTGDEPGSAATRDAVARLLRAVGTGGPDLDAARASGAAVAGLDGAAQLVRLDAWHLRPGAGAVREGTATATWQPSGQDGQLTTPLHVWITQQAGHQYLAGIAPEITGGTS